MKVDNQSEVTQYSWNINRIKLHLTYLEKKRANNPDIIHMLVDYWLEKLYYYQEKEREAIHEQVHTSN